MAHESIEEPPANKLHPFFVKSLPSKPSDPTISASTQVSPVTDQPLETEVTESETTISDGRRKRRKNGTSQSQNGKEPKRQRRRKGGNEDSNQTYLIINPKPEPARSSEAPVENIVSDFPTPPLSDISNIPSTQEPQAASVTGPGDTQIPTATAPLQTPPKAKKVIKFNPKTGTLASPPKRKPKTVPSRIVSISYGRDESSRKDMGDKITQILAGTLRFPSTPEKPRATRTSRNSNSTAPGLEAVPKTTHPFFSGRPAKKAVTKDTSAVRQRSPPARQSIFMSTPMSPKKSRVPLTTEKMPQFGMKTLAKIPGAMQPLWPAQGMSHIRGFETSPECMQDAISGTERSKKSKGRVVTVSAQESIVGQLCEKLNLDLVRDTLPRDPDVFEPAPKELRMPIRHFESGPNLQRRVFSQLHSRPNYSDQDLDDLADRSKRTHPAILRLYQGLETTLSAFDRSTCESQAWTQKYAPTTASQVLQAGREGLLLKEWLQSLNVQSVESGGADGGKGKGKPDAPRKKRKQKKLDGFIVDSEEEENEMSELSDDEDDWAPSGTGLSKRTVIRSAGGSKDRARLTNAIVISGPHGSGKTAAVYAVAKELGYEVFEINSGSRRSGKDILEKVGDMTRNHLVQHGSGPCPEEITEDEVSKDLRSGKQGMMTAFFKPKTPAVTTKPPKKPAEEQQPDARKSTNNKAQKQSLILLEEVDIVYEEDKQFWVTLMGLIAQSKRPFIMTCNDENLVPLQSLSLHGIFRFSPPPTNLAVDLCLLVAASEGHALRRPAVEALYRSRGDDLRATLTELNYWCQIGVGDRRGGFDWFYLRWPKGCDVDETGHVVRVVSEDTYLKGMGWVGRDLIASCADAPKSHERIPQPPLDAEEEAMRQAWDSWTLGMADWQSSLGLGSWASKVSGSAHSPAWLAAYDEFCESMSDADVCSGGAFGMMCEESVDATLPDMPTKAKDDFIIGQRLLEATPKALYSTPHYSMSMAIKSAARMALYKVTVGLDRTQSHDVLTPISEDVAVSILDASFQPRPKSITRMDIALAFDPIAVSEKAQLSSYLDPSVFDRNLKLIVLDVAPWVRGIVEFDHRLMQERLKLSNLLSEGGKRKRMRNTRSAYSALEGGERRTTRRERYFGDSLNTELVRRTRGEKWQEAVMETAAKADDLASVGSISSSPPSEASSGM